MSKPRFHFKGMQNKIIFPSLELSELEAGSTFNIVVAYEDFETGKRAMNVHNYFVEHLGAECLFQNQMWKFEVLAQAKLWEMAVKDACAADIIIVSAHGSNELPKHVTSWIKSWVTEQNHLLALVGLFDPEEHFNNPARAYLADIARHHGIEFFSEPGIWPPTEGRNQQRPLAVAWGQNEKAISILASVVRENVAVSHWGINE